jgi:hypothetical protein
MTKKLDQGQKQPVLAILSINLLGLPGENGIYAPRSDLALGRQADRWLWKKDRAGPGGFFGGERRQKKKFFRRRSAARRRARPPSGP